MMRRAAIGVGLALLTACGAKDAELRALAEDARPWENEAGRIQIRLDLAQWYVDHGHPGRAMDMLRLVREHGGEGREIDMLSARALLQQGALDQATRILQQLGDSDPKDPIPLQALGVAYTELGEIDQAILTFESALQRDPEHVPTLNNLGFLLLTHARCGEAREPLERALELDGTEALYRNNLAFALVCDGDPKEALRLFRSTGSEADARYNLGVAFERLGKVPSAKLQYEHAVQADPAHPAASDALARIGAVAPVMLPSGTEDAQEAHP